MDRKKVDSSMIASVGYDAATQTLELEFAPTKKQVSGAVYTYAEFTAKDWAEFRAAKSIGGHFGQTIRPRFKGVRVGEPVEKEAEGSA